MLTNEFAEIARQLQETVSQLQKANEYHVRMKLLQHLRLLVLEAGRVLEEEASEQDSSKLGQF